MYYNNIYCDKLLKVQLLNNKQMYILVLQISVSLSIHTACLNAVSC